jgi:hypothetical protein
MIKIKYYCAAVGLFLELYDNIDYNKSYIYGLASGIKL